MAEIVRWWVLVSALLTWVTIELRYLRNPALRALHGERLNRRGRAVSIAMAVVVVLVCVAALPAAVVIGTIKKGARRG